MAEVKDIMLKSGQINLEMSTKLIIPEFFMTNSELKNILRSEGIQRLWNTLDICHNVSHCPYAHLCRDGKITQEKCGKLQMMALRANNEIFVMNALGMPMTEKFWGILEEMAASSATGDLGDLTCHYDTIVLEKKLAPKFDIKPLKYKDETVR